MKLKVLALALFFATAVNAASLETTFSQATTEYKAGNFDKAGELFYQAGEMLAKQDLNQASMIWGNAAVAKMKASNYEDAAEIYNKILTSNKNLPAKNKISFSKNLFFCQGQLNERALQAQSIDKFIKSKVKLQSSDLAILYATQADAYRYLELYNLAEAAYQNALKYLPKQGEEEQKAKILTALGLCQGNLGLYDSAIANLKEALKLGEKLKNAQSIVDNNSNLGILSWEKGDYAEALESLNKAIAASEKSQLIRNIGVDKNNLSLVNKSMGNHDEAMNLVNESIKIAQNVKNTKDEGIATVNRALLYRISGQYIEAEQDYKKALELFDLCKFKEGRAGALLGIGKMIEIRDGNFDGALENYNNALKLYEELNLPRSIAETLIQIGNIYKLKLSPTNIATRDLVFEDEETEEIAPAVLLKNCKDNFAKALEIANNLSAQELIWSAHQGLGFAFYKENNLEKAFEHYQNAIDLVTKLNISIKEVEKFGEYMAGKEDLYTEAQSVCADLFDKTQDQKYLNYQFQYAETLKNEIQKASAALAQLHFEDKEKQKLYEQLNLLAKEQTAAEASLPPLVAPKKGDSAEKFAQYELAKQAHQAQKVHIEKLKGDYEKIFAQWKEKYPGDKILFESSARIDIPTIQASITPEQSVVLYTSLPEKLLITVVNKSKVSCVSVDVTKEKLDSLIRDDYVVKYIAKGYGRKYSRISKQQELLALNEVCKTLESLYGYLIEPISDNIQDKKRLYIISDGFLAQIPFGALVSDYDNKGNVNYLIEKYDIGYFRPSFINSLSQTQKVGKIKKLLAIANADNTNVPMSLLPGSIDEIANANNKLSINNDNSDFAFELKNDNNDSKDKIFSLYKPKFSNLTDYPTRPTEQWVRENLQQNSYEVVYFATHGMPYSNIVSTEYQLKKYLKKHNEIYEVNLDKIKNGESVKNTQAYYTVELTKTNLKGQSPLNGYLYLSSEIGDNILKSSVPEERDGLLTIKEIMEIPDYCFNKTKYVFLSACNTGVTFVPDALKFDLDINKDINSIEEERNLRKLGFIPGVDQISFVDTFMRKGISNVYGTLWFVDDSMSSEIMTRFISILVEQGEDTDAVAAYSEAQRSIVRDAKLHKDIKGFPYPQHPFLWAAGAIFGK